MHYNIKWLLARVHRSTLPPSSLHWGVRAVFVFYGDKKDALTGKPLFNDSSCIKAKNMLKEILLGNFIYPPNAPMCMHKLNKNGEQKKDSL